MNDKHNHENNLGSQSIQIRAIFHLLMGSMVRSLDTKSFPAELIFFHTDLQGAQMAGSANEEDREGGGKGCRTRRTGRQAVQTASGKESAHLEKSYSPFCILP
jgi:hypothetical protein